MNNVSIVDARGRREGMMLCLEEGYIVLARKGYAGDGGLDLSGFTVLPGLIDSHVHLQLDGGADPLAGVNFSPPLRERCLELLRRGVVGLRDAGGAFNPGYAQAVLEPPECFPRLICCGRPLTVPGGHCAAIGEPVRGEKEIRSAVQRQLSGEGGWIKIMLTTGVVTGNRPPGQLQFSFDELLAAAIEAHGCGAKVAAHVQSREGVAMAVSAGVDSIEHGLGLTVELAREMARREITLVSTCTGFAAMAGKGRGEMAEKAARALQEQLRAVAVARGCGVRIVAGSDAGTPYNGFCGITAELGWLRRAGLSWPEALASCTIQAAKMLGWNGLGLVAPGYRGDLLIVTGDPLQDPAALDNVAQVLRGCIPAAGKADLWAKEGIA
ncbi:hypothetical protein A6M21_07940 [Desulfotomaculum copahuensis]|uniref:Amidohydrolase-related domain-containing protein n=1 Tax=Desulfotomaculum copahuensis TaxID=1838280 RepID=A0A1B7LG54_9FIRM|nr:hypothetical protein A6M21_07940 [Desulfotomaculum copahuensis]